MAEVELTPLPEGLDDSAFVKPVALAKELEIRPQIVYGWIRNGGLPAYTDAEGNGRYIIRSEFADWQSAKEQRKAERAQKAAEKAAKKEAAGDSAEDEDEEEEYEED